MGELRKSKNVGREPWPYNPLVTLIRQHSTEIIAETIGQYEKEHQFKTSAFDLVIQVMIVSCSYLPKDIWLAESTDIAIATEYVSKGAADMALDVLESAIESGDVRLNEDLIKDIARHQIERLHQIHESHKEKNEVPDHDHRALSYFSPHAELTALRLTAINDKSNIYEAVATEAISNEEVVFKPVDLKLSKAFIESFHYLHVARDDDVLAFGAFIKGEKAPFALVCYAPVSRIYKQAMLRAAGIDPEQSLELTRAWNSELSPKNAMSMLYGYAHANIQRLWQEQRGSQPQAILTAVNPNLGFRGSAFRAVGFGVIGEKPTSYHYIIGKGGKRSFTVRRNLTTMLQEESTPVQFMRATMPLLATKELAVILNGRKRSRPSANFYSVTEAEYRKEAQRLSSKAPKKKTRK